MVRLAWRMLRAHPSTIIATFVALWFAVVVVTACGAMLESGVRYHGALQRYAGTPVLVATTDITTIEGSGEDRDFERTPLTGRGYVDPALVARIEAAPGLAPPRVRRSSRGRHTRLASTPIWPRTPGRTR